MIQIKMFLESLKGKGFEMGSSCCRRFTIGKEKRSVLCSFMWIGNEILYIVVMKRENGYELSIGEIAKEKSLGIVNSQREVISMLKSALGM